ncbi:chain length determinant protein EpsF [Variovorax sp. HJSM1_2]|uniref:chain length determinant protein EpsF n=1 Tax=Variovorax sp. HJSM1_2 TaxID=3366263 RepID=UPI003BE5FE4C
MTITEILIALRARWRIAALVWVLVVSFVVGITLLRTPQYTATAAAVLDVKSPDPIAGVVLPGLNTAGYMATQLNVIQSERVAIRAIEKLGLDQDAKLQNQWREDTDGQGEFKSWLAGGMMQKLDVTPTKDSNVITVAYTSPDPAFAADVANAWVKAYIETTLELRVEPAKQYNGFFDTRGKELRSVLEEAQARLSGFQQKSGIIATDEKVDAESLRLAELTSQLVVLQGISNESSGRQSQSVGNPNRMPEVFNNPLILSMSTELGRDEARLNELSAKLGENYPEIVELRAKIAQIKSAIDSETKRIVGSLVVTNNINQTRLAQLQASVAEQRVKLLGLKSQRDQLTVLQRDVENAQRSYDAIVSRAGQSDMESQTTQTNVSVLKRAVAPIKPSSPRVALNIAVSFLVGALLALAAALMREARDRRLRTDGDVLKSLRLPLLGVLPAKSNSKRGSARLRPASGFKAIKTA